VYKQEKTGGEEPLEAAAQKEKNMQSLDNQQEEIKVNVSTDGDSENKSTKDIGNKEE
jgi:hypothetical protein